MAGRNMKWVVDVLKICTRVVEKVDHAKKVSLPLQFLGVSRRNRRPSEVQVNIIRLVHS
tara:strand:- start:1107 stop:1283 length:177 start_codon:yes stop_codon:yes gene_type:complete